MRFAGLAAALFLAALGSSCLTATQITLEIRTTISCGDRLEWVEIAVGKTGAALDDTDPVARAPERATLTCMDGKIGTLVLVPRGDERVSVRVAGHVRLPSPPPNATPTCRGPSPGPDCVVARRRIGFVHHTKLTLPIVLENACVGVVCPPDKTCVGGACRSADCDSDPTLCATPDAGVLDASTDATLPDAAIDAGLDGNPGGQCVSAGDCILVSNYCDDAMHPPVCTCYVVSNKSMILPCTSMGTCILDPCMSNTADCQNGTCVKQ